jgi:hypothetical protein
MFVVVLTILLVAIKPMLEGVGERGMYSATGGEFVERVGCVWVCPEQRPEVERLCWCRVRGILKKAVLEVGSSEGRGQRNRLLPSVVTLSFRQWGKGRGMMSLCLQTAGFLYLESRSISEVRLPWMTDHEGFLLLLTDEAPMMTDPEGFLLLLTDEAPRMTDPEGFLLLAFGSEGFVLAAGYLPL